jgi:hypothetical protein
MIHVEGNAMHKTRIWLFVLFLVLLAAGGYILSQTSTAFGSRVSAGPTLLHEEIRDYHPLGVTQRIKYSYPNRPFDTDLTIEGIGWTDGKAFLLLQAQVNTQDLTYSHVAKLFSPRVTFQGKTVVFSRMLWEEGANGNFDGSIYRYAVAADEPGFLPQGKMPDRIQVSHADYPLPKELPGSQTIPALHLLSAKTGRAQKIIDSGELRYAVTSFLADDKRRELTLLVTSEMGNEETSRFLLQDDKGRIYTFTSDSLPKSYSSGDHEIVLRINEKLPADMEHLKLVIFEVELQQLALYNITSQASIEIF